MTSNTSRLVFLRETETREKKPKSLTQQAAWFQDDRALPQHTATYLKRLRTLRNELFIQEQDNRMNAVGRLNDDSKTSRRKNWVSADVPLDKHSKMQLQRRMDIEQHRHGAFDTSALLNPLKGERVLNAGSLRNTTPCSTPGRSYPAPKDLQNVVDSQKSRLSKKHQQLFAAPTPASTGFQLRITLERQNGAEKKLKEHDKENAEQRSGPKRHKGIYHGNQLSSVLRTDKDEKQDLRLRALKFNGKYQEDQSNAIDISNRYSAPSTTPIPWEERHQAKKKQEKDGDIRDHQVAQEEQVTNFPHDVLEKYKYGWPLHQALLRTKTSLYAPSIHGYIRIAKAALPDPKPQQVIMEDAELTSLTSKEGASTIPSQVNLQATSISKHETINSFPDTVPMEAENGEIILVNKSNTDLEYPRDITGEVTFTSPHYTRPATRIDSKDAETRPANHQLVVEMPDIVLSPPSPRIATAPDDSAVSLRKTFRQIELKEKEVSHLLEDVKELNKFTDDLRGAHEGYHDDEKDDDKDMDEVEHPDM